MPKWWDAFLPRRGVTITAADAFRAGAARRADPDAPIPSPIHGTSALAVPDVDAPRGVSGTAIFGGEISGEEYVEELKGRKALEIFDKMRKSADVGSTLTVMKLPLRGATWTVNPPKGGDATDEAIAAQIQSWLFAEGAMTDSWDRTLQHILLQLDFGFSILEKIWTVDDDGFYRIKRLAPRLPKTIHYWHTRRDGSLVRVWQYAPVMDERDEPSGRPVRGPMGGSTHLPMPPSSRYEYLALPAESLVVFTFQREGDNYEGRSMLRGAYLPWYYKTLLYHLDSVRHDRLGIGIPTAELSPEAGLTADELNDLKEVLSGLRANERVYLIAPPGVKYRILGPEGGGGTTSGAQSMIEHYDGMITRNAIAGFLSAGRDTFGTRGGMTRLTDFFVASLQGIGAGITGDLQTGVIRELCLLNFDMTGREFPTLAISDLETEDLEKLLTLAINAMPKIITPDDDLEAWFREMLSLPTVAPGATRSAKERIESGEPGEGDDDDDADADGEEADEDPPKPDEKPAKGKKDKDTPTGKDKDA